MFTITITETKPQRSIAEAVDREAESVEVLRCTVLELDLAEVFAAIHKRRRKDAGIPRKPRPGNGQQPDLATR